MQYHYLLHLSRINIAAVEQVTLIKCSNSSIKIIYLLHLEEFQIQVFCLFGPALLSVSYGRL